MFTALTDAPAVIQPSRIVTGNDDGSALTFSDNVLQVPETGSLFVVPLNPDTNEYGGALSVVGSGDFTADADTFAGGLSFPSATAWADLATSGVTLRTGDGGQAGLAINADNVALEAIGGRTLKVGGFDVVASDASAHMTVGGVEYSIAKAIKVQIGSDIFFWPLFGPV